MRFQGLGIRVERQDHSLTLVLVKKLLGAIRWPLQCLHIPNNMCTTPATFENPVQYLHISYDYLHGKGYDHVLQVFLVEEVVGRDNFLGRDKMPIQLHQLAPVVRCGCGPTRREVPAGA